MWYAILDARSHNTSRGLSVGLANAHDRVPLPLGANKGQHKRREEFSTTDMLTMAARGHRMHILLIEFKSDRSRPVLGGNLHPIMDSFNICFCTQRCGVYLFRRTTRIHLTIPELARGTLEPYTSQVVNRDLHQASDLEFDSALARRPDRARFEG